MTSLCVGLLAGSAAWEATALELIEAAPRMVVLRRCVDLDDLMASVTTGQLHVVVLAAESVGLDVAAVQHLRRHQVEVVAVLGAGAPEHAPERLGQIGIRTVVPHSGVGDIVSVVRAVAESGAAASDGARQRGESRSVLPAPRTALATGPDPSLVVPVQATVPGTVLAVWGPSGAPGRTTVAAALAGMLAERGRQVVLVDADPHASVAQQLGVMDQVSGVLASARLQAAGTLPGRVQGVCRALTPKLSVLTGLPRPDRRDEVLPGAMVEVVDALTTFADVVIDLGSGLDTDVAIGAPGVWTLDLLDRADEVLVVGSADPVGLTRLAHALADLKEECGDGDVRVLVNRVRPTLGFSEKEMSDLVTRLASVRALHFVPDDQPSVDRAVVLGEPAADPHSRFARALVPVLDGLRPDTVTATPPLPGQRARLTTQLFRRRTAGTALPQ